MSKPKKKGELLANRKMWDRERYLQIKNDPVLYAAQKEKERKRYQKRKCQNKIKSIDELTEREKRIQRAKWRENSRRYIQKQAEIKKNEHFIINTAIKEEVCAFSVASNLIQDPLDLRNEPGPSKITEKKRIKNDDSKEKAEMLNQIEKLKLENEQLRNRIAGLEERREVDTPAEDNENEVLLNTKNKFKDSKSSKGREKKLEKMRLRQRERYLKIKNDPELYAAEKEKERQRYQERKRQNKIKSIDNLSEREKRIQRKKWRENSRRHFKKQAEFRP